MEEMIFVSDFDGTITEKDSLYYFFKEYAVPEWKIVEEQWVKGEISSKECLIREFELVPNLCEKLIDEFVSSLNVDRYFKQFNEKRIEKGYDFVIVSDGLDYFINKNLKYNNIKNIKVITNHAEFINDKFTLEFPNSHTSCKNDAGTCKCQVIKDLRKNYKKICYIGDGVSDFCAADKADILYAKKSLLKHCKENQIPCIEYENYGDIIKIFD